MSALLDWVKRFGGLILTGELLSTAVKRELLAAVGFWWIVGGTAATWGAVYVIPYLLRPYYYKLLIPLYQKRARGSSLAKRIVRWFRPAEEAHWFDTITKSWEWLSDPRPRVGPNFDTARRWPPVIRSTHLRAGSAAEAKEFSILLLFNGIVLKRKGTDRFKHTLEVNLGAEERAIYNNQGKAFLLDEFPAGRSSVSTGSESVSGRSHSMLMGRSEQKELRISVHPLRWVSCGFLPIAMWRNRRWVCLFFRDAVPIGLTIANGASESEREYYELEEVIYREGFEELVVCNGEPKTGATIQRCPLRLPGSPPPDLALARDHYRLRSAHDNIEFAQDEAPPDRNVSVLLTGNSVVVQGFSRSWRGPKRHRKTTNDVLLAVNPREHGVEIVRPGEFELKDGEYLLDGEVQQASGREYLVRRPVVMISADFLRRVYESHGGSLGNVSDDFATKSLGAVPREEFRIFSEDIVLRRRRQLELTQRQSGSDAAESLSRSDAHELERINQWLDRYASAFLQAPLEGSTAQGGFPSEYARLLPAAWKPIEQAIARGFI